MKPSRDWATFLPIQEPNTNDKVSALDPGWCLASGVYPGADVVLRLLRDEVLPLVRHLERRHGLIAYHFLVHGRLSGVPTVETDNGSYIHLRLTFKKPKESLDLVHSPRFVMTRSVTNGGVPGGIDGSLVSVAACAKLINAQSAWVLALIEAHRWKDDALMVRQVQQFLHFFSNMLQIKVN